MSTVTDCWINQLQGATGANCYYLMTRAASDDPHLRAEVTGVLDTAVKLQLGHLRAWAFADGNCWNALQPNPGSFDERIFQGLDFVVEQAKARNLKLMLVLTDYFPSYGGLQQYVRWSRGVDKDAPALAEEFYQDPKCHAMFEAFCRAVLFRVNTLTGVRYRDEPAILAWEVCNEPRCKRSSGVPSEAMHAWVSKATAMLRSLDPHHLVTVGTDGFFGPSSPGLLIANPWNCKDEGCDFVRTISDPNLDFASFHLHPDHWLPLNTHASEVAVFVQRWIHAHMIAARQAGKPLVLTEFGSRQRVCVEWKGCRSGALELQAAQQESSCGYAALEHKHEEQEQAGYMERAAFYDQVLSLCTDAGPPVSQHTTGWHPSKNQLSAESGCGAFFWMLAAPTYADYDGFSVYTQHNHQQPLILDKSNAEAKVVLRWSKARKDKAW